MLESEYTHLIFPERLIPILLDERGADWQRLVRDTLERSPDSVEQVAFILLVARLSGCATCHANALRALRGCAICAKQSVGRFRGSDQELVALHKQSCKEVEGFWSAGNNHSRR
ncbi:MAG: hypothetical protein A2W36_06225 [Chloroflexi bacterium RBG_16_58_14]|nr:MAG: hypothetical protein A2W36_06225 [Chloroflexi bacterium RBG_16_58_14]